MSGTICDMFGESVVSPAARRIVSAVCQSLSRSGCIILTRPKEILIPRNAIQKDTNSKVVVDVAVTDQNIACSASNLNAVPQFPKQYCCDRGLHNTFDSDAVSLGMLSDNFEQQGE